MVYVKMHYILVKVPCECITGNIARGRGREPIKHEAQPSALFARDHAPRAIIIMCRCSVIIWQCALYYILCIIIWSEKLPKNYIIFKY